MKELFVQETLVSLTRAHGDDYISLTDIVRVRKPDESMIVVKNGLTNRVTVKVAESWDRIGSIGLKGIEFDSVKFQAGSNSFTLLLEKWIVASGVIGIKCIVMRSGDASNTRYSVCECAPWLPAECKLYMIKQSRRLKLFSELSIGKLCVSMGLNRAGKRK